MHLALPPSSPTMKLPSTNWVLISPNSEPHLLTTTDSRGIFKFEERLRERDPSYANPRSSPLPLRPLLLLGFPSRFRMREKLCGKHDSFHYGHFCHFTALCFLPHLVFPPKATLIFNQKNESIMPHLKVDRPVNFPQRISKYHFNENFN